MGLIVRDYYCGLGGWTCGVIQHFKSTDVNDAVFHGYDNDKVQLDQWAANVKSSGFVAVPHLVTIDDSFVFPPDDDDLIVHFSPPCRAHSQARTQSKTTAPSADEMFDARREMERVLDTVVRHRYRRFSVENVAVDSVKRIVESFTVRNPWMASLQLDASKLGCPSDRRRLFVAPAGVVAALEKLSVPRVSIRTAMAERGLAIPTGATAIRNANSATADHRDLDGQSFTLLASHPLAWTDGKTTVRVVNTAESAALLTFPSEWKPATLREHALRGIGNSVAPIVAIAIVRCMFDAVPIGSPREIDSPSVPPESSISEKTTVDALRKEFRESIDSLRSEFNTLVTTAVADALASRKRARDSDYASDA
jgi:site-specific DNA-cytosine methylase